MGAAKAYLFRVLSHSATSYSVSDTFRYDLPDNVKRRAVTAGLIGGILFFIVAIVLSVCTVKICNKRRRRKHDRGKNLAKKNFEFPKIIIARLFEWCFWMQHFCFIWNNSDVSGETKSYACFKIWMWMFVIMKVLRNSSWIHAYFQSSICIPWSLFTYDQT